MAHFSSPTIISAKKKKKKEQMVSYRSLYIQKNE